MDNEKRNLKSEFQLGWDIGRYIVDNHLPTLSTDMLKSSKVIQVSKEDSLENKRLDDQWYETTRYGQKWNGLNENGDKEKWNLYLLHNKFLEKKYLPNPLKCKIELIKIQNLNEFKRGLRTYLWDCDMCTYNIELDKIKIYNDEDCSNTIIELNLR